MTIQAIKTNRTDYLKKIRGGIFCLLCLLTFLCGMSAWGEEFVLKKDDAWGETALVSGYWASSSSVTAPIAGNTYVVPKDKLIRTLNGTAETIFAGDSLTLQTGAVLALKHMNAEMVTIPNLILEAGSEIRLANGNDNGFLAGTYMVNGTAASPVAICGNGSGAPRLVKLSASLTGGETAVVQITSAKATQDRVEGWSYYAQLLGDNSNYHGSFKVDTTDARHDIAIMAKSPNALGAGSSSTPVIQLTRGAKYDAALWGIDGYAFTNKNYSIKIDGDVVLGGCSTDGSDVGFYVGGESRISGVGKITVPAALNVPKYNGGPTYVRAAVEMGSVTMSGPTNISVVSHAKLRLSEGYNNLSIPLRAYSNAELEIVFSDSSTGIATGDIELSEGVRITIVPQDIGALCTNLTEGTEIKILTAPNLGTEDGLTIDDFVFDKKYQTLPEISSALSIKEINGVNYLVWTRPVKTYVFKTGGDSSGSAGFSAKHNWSDGKAPSADKAYVVDGPGMVLRGPEQASTTPFQGEYLVLQNGGQMVTLQKTIVVPKLHMGAGGRVRLVRENYDSPIPALDGTGIVYGTKENPFVIEFFAATASNWKKFSLPMKLSGSGDIVCLFEGDKLYKSSHLYVTGNNVDFTGGVTLKRPLNSSYTDLLVVDFASEAAMGGPAPKFRADRLKLINGSKILCSSSYETVDMTRGITIENGARFEVTEGQTLGLNNIIAGNGNIVKYGVGTLALNGENVGLTSDDKVVIYEGRLTLGNTNAVNARAITFGKASSSVETTLRIASVEGIRVKPDVDAAFVQAGTVKPKLEVAELENLAGATKVVKLFRYTNAIELEAQTFADKFDLAVFPSGGNYTVEWGTKVVSEPVTDASGKVTKNGEFAVTLTVKPKGFTIFIR